MRKIELGFDGNQWWVFNPIMSKVDDQMSIGCWYFILLNSVFDHWWRRILLYIFGYGVSVVGS